MHIGDLERNNCFTVYRAGCVIFPFRYASLGEDPLSCGLNPGARVLWIFRRDCVLVRALASPRLASHEFCNKSRVGGAHLFSLPSATLNIFSPGSPFSTLLSLPPSPSVRIQPPCLLSWNFPSA